MAELRTFGLLAASVHILFHAVCCLIHFITDYEASLGGSNVA